MPDPLFVRECGYAEQAARIADYQIVHAAEAEGPYLECAYPDGCSVCGTATWWENRRLSDGRYQTRCQECGDVVTFR